MKAPDFDYNVMHFITISTAYGEFEDVPAFFAYNDWKYPGEGVTLAGVMIGDESLSRAQVVRMIGAEEYARQRDFWDQWWADEGYPSEVASQREWQASYDRCNRGAAE